jgi:hypothetical protein
MKTEIKIYVREYKCVNPYCHDRPVYITHLRDEKHAWHDWCGNKLEYVRDVSVHSMEKKPGVFEKYMK